MKTKPSPLENLLGWNDVFDLISDGICLLDINGYILKSNPAMATLARRPANELQNMYCLDVFQIKDNAVFREQLARVRDTRQRGDVDVVFQELGYRLTLEPVLDPDGQTIRFLQIISGLPEQKKGRSKKVRAKEFLQGVQDAFTAHIAILDAEGNIVQVNQSWRSFGVSNQLKDPNFCLGINYLQVCDAATGDGHEEAAQTAQLIRDVLAGVRETGMIEYSCHSQREKRWFELHISSFEADGGRWVVLAHENVTYRVVARQVQRTEEQKYQVITENVNDIVWAMDRHFLFTYASPAVTRVLGYSSEEVLQMHVTEILDEASLLQMKENIVERLVRTAPNSNEPFEYRMKHKDGLWVDVEVLSSPSFNSAGELVGFVGVTRDISRRKRVEREQMVLLEILQGLTISKDMQGFLQQVHTSLNQILRAQNFFITLYDSSSGLFNEIYSVDEFDSIAPPSHLEKTITSYIFRTEKTFLYTPEQFEELCALGELELVGARPASLLGVPLMVAGQAMGVMIIQDYQLSNAYSERDARFLASIAGQVALAVQRRKAEETLRETHRRYAIVADNTEAWEFWLSPEYQYVYISPSCQSITGYSSEEFIRDPALLFRIIHPDDVTIYERHVHDLCETEESEHLQFRIQNRNGSTVWIEHTCHPLYDENGVFLGRRGSHRNITRRKTAEWKLQQANERFTLLVNNISDIFWIANSITGEEIFVSPAFEEIAGVHYDIVKKYPNGYIDIVLPEDQPIVFESYEQEVLGRPTDIQYRIRRPDGSIRWLRDKGTPIIGKDGVVAMVVGVARDITAQVNAEFLLSESEARFRQMAENIQELFWMFDHQQGGWIYLSPAYQKLWGSSISDVLQNPQKHFDAVHLADRDLVYHARERQERGEPTELEYRVVHPNGLVLWIHDRSVPIFHSDGLLLRTTGIATDITERKRAEQERQKLIHDLGERVKELTALHQTSRLLSHPDLPEAQIMQGLVELLPPAWQYPEITAARIQVENIIYETANFKETGWKQKVDFTLPDGRPGKIEIVYLEERPDEYDGPFLMEERSLLETIAERLQASMVRKQMEYELREYAKDLTNLLDAGRELGKTLDFQEIYSIIYRCIKASLPCDMLIVSSFDHATQMLTCQYLQTSAGEQDVSVFPKIPLEPPGQGTQSRVIHTGDSLLLPDFIRSLQTATNSYHFDENANIVDEVPDGEAHTRSAILVPLKVEGNTVGVLQVFSNQLHAHTIDHLRFVETLALHASAALSHARLVAELEQRVQERTAEEQDLYNNAPIGYYSLDADGDFFRVNQTQLTWLGYRAEEMIGRPILQFLTPASQHIFRQTFSDFKQKGMLHDLEFEFVRKDGSILPGLVSATALYDAQGNFRMSRTTLFDNTEHRRAEETLRRANAEMQRALRLKDEFLANMSHELRTPLNAILGISESLSEQIAGTLNEKQLRYLDVIHESGEHLLRLINDILDLSKIEAGKITLELADVNVIKVCEASLRIIKEIAQKKNHQVTLSVDPTLDLIHADERRLKQILVNLLSNAVKFTLPGGKIGLQVQADSEHGQVQFSVWDTGIGIKAADLARLFQPFVQLDGGLTREQSGTGLGLALVSQMARMHGGSVRVESQPGEGSRFIISLPWNSAHAARQLDATAAQEGNLKHPVYRASQQRTLLLIEDTQSVALLISDYLTSLGYHVVTTPNGLTGLEKARELQPDLVMMDVQMPVMDGLETTRRLRNEAAPLNQTPIIALTALATEQDRERCLAAGMTAYLSKPVRLRELAETIYKLLEPPARGA